MIKNNFNKKVFGFLIFIIIFFIDRLSKIYILNLAEESQSLDIYINSYLNLYLIWNTGIGFGFFSSDTSFSYNLITFIIIIINIIILVMVFTAKKYQSLIFLVILGGSSGNLFDRIYYNAVPDFIDFHYKDFHWFIFNIADIFITIGIICLILAEVFLNSKRN